MKSVDINSLYDEFGKLSAGKLSPDDQSLLTSKLEAITTVSDASEANKFLKLLALLREAQAKAIGGLGHAAMATIVGAFAGGEEGIYAGNPDLMNARFIFELVQNVDDCKYKDVNDCKLNIEFDIRNDVIRLEYNELGFQPENVMAITGLGNSTKNHKKASDIKTEKELLERDLQEIGEKGIGFKSIFGLAKSVRIISQYFSFGIDRENFFVPVVGDYSHFKYVDKTILELKLDDDLVGELYGFLKKKYDNVTAVVNENPILFLNKLTEIRYYADENDYFGFRVTRGSIEKEYEEEETKIEYFSADKQKNKTIDAYRFTHQVEYSLDECRARYGEQEDTTRKHKIVVISPKNPDLISIGRIYSFFATEECINAPFIIHAPFRLNSGRTKIDSQSQGIYNNNAWYQRTKNEIMAMINNVYEKMAIIVGNDIRYYIPENNLFDEKCVLRTCGLTKDMILKWNIFETVNGDHVPAKDVCIIEYDVQQEEVTEIHRILGIKSQLLKLESKFIPYFNKFNILIIKDIKNKLLKAAFDDEDVTDRCLEIIGDYTPQLIRSEVSIHDISLSYRQICAFSQYKKISEWINEFTLNYFVGRTNLRTGDTYSGSTKDIGQIINFCEDYGEAINKQFVNYITRIDYVETDFENTIFTYNHVFGRNMLSDFAEAYHRMDNKDKFFYPFLQIEAVSEEIDILCNKNEEISDYDFLSLLGGHRRNQKNMLGNQYKSILDLIENSGTNPERFFTEILQNIDDCVYLEEPSASIRYDRSGESHRLICEYNEIGFSREQIRAITAIGDSTKKKLLSSEAVGEKGIGFKSVFGICNSVKIESGKLSFILYADKPTVPEYIKEIDERKGTKMTFTLKPSIVENVKLIITDFNKVISNCLCLKKVHNISFNQKLLMISDKSNIRTIEFDNKKIEFLLHKHPIIITNPVALYERSKTKAVLENQVATYLIPFKYPENEYSPQYCVYSTFPTEEPVYINMIIDMPLELSTSREKILFGEWNKEVVSKTMDGLIDVYEEIKSIFKSSLPRFFPRKGCVLGHKYGQSLTILSDLIDKPLFKAWNSDDYYPLYKGSFTNDFEYKILNEYAEDLTGIVPKSILEKNENYYQKLIELFGDYIRVRKADDICRVVDHLLKIKNKEDYALISEKEFRESLYVFLEENFIEKSARMVKTWKIIPIRYQKKTRYDAYTKDIYAPAGGGDIDSEKYKILDTNVMSVKSYNAIYASINDGYCPIQKFSREVVIEEFFGELSKVLSVVELKERAIKIKELYISEKRLFEETYKTRKNFPKDSIPFFTRTKEIKFIDRCYICNSKESQGVLDQIIVSEEYKDLAQLLEMHSVEEINDCAQIPFTIGRNELKELNCNRILQRKNQIFNSLYVLEDKANELKDGEGFFELYVLTSTKVRTSYDQKKKIISIDSKCLTRYAKEINAISVGQEPISFNIDVNLNEFEKDNLLAEIEDELQVRKETDRINRILGMLNNCYYFDIGTREPCCVREQNRELLLIDSKITSDYDVIEVLKAYFLSYFSTELSVNRNIRLYTRRGYENITTINSTDEDVSVAVEMLKYVNISIVEDVKDFLCKPMVIKGKTFGGYAKTCPLCNARVDTELTGMRVYKTKCNGKIVPIISCSNCHESLRYSNSIKIDMDKLEAGLLNIECDVNGFKWCVNDVILRVAHRAFIKKINKED